MSATALSRLTGDAELWKPAYRVAQRCCPRIPLPTTQEPPRCHLPLSGPESTYAGIQLYRGAAGRLRPENPTGVFTVCTQVATPLETLGYACPACIGFFITETPSTGVPSVAGWSSVPRRTTCPHLSGYTGCWLEVPSTTASYSMLHIILSF